MDIQGTNKQVFVCRLRKAPDLSATDYELDFCKLASSGWKEPANISSLPLFIRHCRHSSPPPETKELFEPVHSEQASAAQTKGFLLTVENLHTYTA